MRQFHNPPPRLSMSQPVGSRPSNEKRIHKTAKSFVERRTQSRAPFRLNRPHLKEEALHASIQAMLRGESE